MLGIIGLKAKEALTGEVEVICSKVGLEIVLGDVARFSFKQGVKQRVRSIPVGGYEVRALDHGQTVWQGQVEVRDNKSSLVRIEVKTGPEPGEVWTEPMTGMEFVWVPEGWFMMGSPDSDEEVDVDEKPQHKVELDGFWMGRYPVTNQEYRQFKSNHNSWEDYNEPRQPVVEVSWEDATAYAKWLTKKAVHVFRLPTEAQWEYAARSGGEELKYPWGNELLKNNVNCEGCGSKRDDKSTSPVGSFKANGLGLYDMSGNVWEWCQDRFDAGFYNSPEARKRSPVCTNDASGWRVLRGGSWGYDAGDVRCAFRNGSNPDDRVNGLGFRLVCLPQDR